MHAHARAGEEVAWKHGVSLPDRIFSSSSIAYYWPWMVHSSKSPIACLPNIYCLDTDLSRYQTPSGTGRARPVWRRTKLASNYHDNCSSLSLSTSPTYLSVPITEHPSMYMLENGTGRKRTALHACGALCHTLVWRDSDLGKSMFESKT